jgi:hypothetical protein
MLLIFTCIIQAYGMSALPMSLIKGHSSAKIELERIRQKQTENKARIQAMRDKVSIFIQKCQIIKTYIYKV